MRQIKKGSTDKSVIIRIVDATDGTPEQAVEHDTSGIALWYRREGATVTAITEAALASLDAAHSDGGIEHIDDGYYRLDIPDAAWATGASHVMIGGAVTDMVVIGTEVQLVNFDPEDAVRLGLTALPNAAADAAGGLPISDAGGLDLDAKLANTNEVTAARMGALTDLIDGGRLDLLIDAILLDTDTTLDDKIDTIDTIVDTIVARVVGTIAAGTHNPQSGDTYARLGAPAGASIAADIAAVEAQTDDIGAAGAGLTGIPWNAAWDAEVQSEVADGLAAYDPPTKAEMDAGFAALNDVAVADILAGVIDGTVDLAEALKLILAKGSGNITKSGNAYTYHDRSNVALFTLTMAADAVTRS